MYLPINHGLTIYFHHDIRKTTSVSRPINGKTLVEVNSASMKSKKMDAAIEVGKEIAKKAKAAKINKVVFDRNGYKYTGRILALAEAAREAGLEF